MSYFSLFNKITGYTDGDTLIISIRGKSVKLSKEEALILPKLINNVNNDFFIKKRTRPHISITFSNVNEKNKWS